MTATARLTIGENAAPNSAFGSMVLVIVPATNPTGNRTTIDGRRSVVATIWQPTARASRRPSPTKISELVMCPRSTSAAPTSIGPPSSNASFTPGDVIRRRSPDEYKLASSSASL